MAGGAGKTQVALLLAQQLAHEVPLAILSRGYLGEAEHGADPLVIDIAQHSAARSGDEPWLLASRLQAACVVVNKNRFKSAQTAEKWGAKLLILDDGMQHRQLHRDFEIVVIDGKSPIDSFLPKGNVREDCRQLKKADLIIFIGAPDPTLKEKISKFSPAPQAVAQIVSQGVFQLNGSPVERVAGQRVGVFCGIGNPHRFVATVKQLGMEVVATHFSKDHRLVKEKKLYQFATDTQQKGGAFLLCTEKDRVKLLPKSQTLPLPICWLKAALTVVENQSGWSKAVSEIKQLAQITCAIADHRREELSYSLSRSES